jgi:hypothetical protein
MRSMVANAHGEEYRHFESLSDARKSAKGIVVLEGDYGGQIYVVARVSDIGCTEEDLRQLLADIDAQQWRDPEGQQLCFEEADIGQGIPGGVGGGLVCEKPWIHPELHFLEPSIQAVLNAKAKRIAT